MCCDKFRHTSKCINKESSKQMGISVVLLHTVSTCWWVCLHASTAHVPRSAWKSGVVFKQANGRAK